LFLRPDIIYFFSYLPAKIPGLIESNDADLRNQAGETIAVLYEIAREIQSVCRNLKKTLNNFDKFHLDLC
jgi:hypothetical protein